MTFKTCGQVPLLAMRSAIRLSPRGLSMLAYQESRQRKIQARLGEYHLGESRTERLQPCHNMISS